MKKFGIIGAMDVEVALLKEQMTQSSTYHECNLDFIEGTLCGFPAVVVKSGIGKVNAAMCTQLLINRFGVTHVVNTGAAGAFASGLGVLDIVISTELVYHDVDVTAWGYEPCAVPGMQVAFKADSELVECAKKACEANLPERKCICGRIASGDQFIASREQKNKIKELCNPACVEMEGASIAHVCTQNGIPFVVLRSMSDMADDDAGSTAEFNEKNAGETSAILVTAMLKELK